MLKKLSIVEPISLSSQTSKYGYTTYRTSQFQNCIGLNILLSDVVGLVTSISAERWISRAKTSSYHRRTDTCSAVVTLWGKLADAFDAESLQRRSTDEPTVILFVGMSVNKFNGTLAFKSILATPWYINHTIHETAAIL